MYLIQRFGLVLFLSAARVSFRNLDKLWLGQIEVLLLSRVRGTVVVIGRVTYFYIGTESWYSRWFRVSPRTVVGVLRLCKGIALSWAYMKGIDMHEMHIVNIVSLHSNCEEASFY